MQKTRKKSRRILPLTLLLAAAIALYLYLQGGGFGIGIGERGEPADPQQEKAGDSDAAPAEVVSACELRLDARGLSTGGRPIAVEEAAAACAGAGRAILTATGDANYGELERVREELARAGIDVSIR